MRIFNKIIDFMYSIFEEDEYSHKHLPLQTSTTKKSEIEIINKQNTEIKVYKKPNTLNRQRVDDRELHLKLMNVSADTCNYTIAGDGTYLDDLIMTISKNFSQGYESIQINGLCRFPRKMYYSDEWLKKTINGYEKLVKINFKIKGYKYALDEIHNKAMEVYKQNPTNYITQVYSEQNNKVAEIIGLGIKKFTDDFYITTGYSTSQKLTSIWISIWIPYDIYTFLTHCDAGLSSYAKQHKNEISLLIENKLDGLDQFKMLCCHTDLRNKLLKKYENQLRKNHGVPKIGQGNLSQYTLFSLIRKHYQHVKYEHSPLWLGRMRFDIYIPSLKTAIEYHGLQHYQPVECFGGIENFEKTQIRDKHKIELSKQNGIKVYEWPYSRPVTITEVEKFIIEHI